MKQRFRNIALHKRAALYTATLLLLWYICCLPRQLFDVPYATVVTDRHGELLGARIATDGQWRFPPCKAVSNKFATCLITFEDRYYHLHPGVNPPAMARALWQNIRTRRVVSGGSTLTMQTIRLARNKKRTFYEKCVEMILATRLELRYSKDEILAIYASHAPFGGNVVGLDAAAWRFFGHDAEQFSWAEAATLAVLPNAPALIHLARNRDALLKKRNRLLKRLYRNGTIDKIDYDLALTEPLPSAPLPLPQTAPHLTSYFHLNRLGMHTVSSLDKSLQMQVEHLLALRSAEFARSDIRNLAALVIDVRTNQVLAYCGNVRFDDPSSGNQVDVIRSPRSTGSILKPLLYYAALQDGDLLPHMLLPDVPVNMNGFSPQNFSMQFDGAVPASEAIARSLNVPSVIMLQRHGAPKFYDFLKRAGLSTLHKPADYYGLSLILGGAEATLWDVTAAYTDMARALIGVERTRCSLVVNETVETLPTLFHPGAVWQTFDAIKEVNRPEEIDRRMMPSVQTVAWKTGTSYGFRDAWAVGVTTRYAVGVWVGNASGEGKPELVGARTAAPVLFDIFNLLPTSPWFERPEDAFADAEICAQSGHLKGRFCDETYKGLILPNGLKTQMCPYHIPVVLRADERFRVFEHCAGSDAVVRRNWFVLPTAWEWYYKQRRPAYRSLPPFAPGCGNDARPPMQFIYPQGNYVTISLPKQLDGSAGEVTFTLAHSNRETTIFWHLDESYLTATRDFHKVSLTPAVGQHRLTVVDSNGHTLSITFTVAPS